MRRLHVVGKQEKFVASGVYRVYADDEPTGLVEHWSIHEVGDGAQFIRVDIDGRDVDGGSTLMEALLNPDGAFERVDRHDYQQHSSKPGKMSYTFFADYVELVSGVADSERLSLAQGYAAVAASLILMGFALVGAQNRIFPTMSSDICPDGHWDYQGQERLSMSGHDIDTRHYACSQTSAVWLDEYDVLMCLVTGQKRMILTQYGRRPELKPNV